MSIMRSPECLTIKNFVHSYWKLLAAANVLNSKVDIYQQIINVLNSKADIYQQIINVLDSKADIYKQITNVLNSKVDIHKQITNVLNSKVDIHKQITVKLYYKNCDSFLAVKMLGYNLCYTT